MSDEALFQRAAGHAGRYRAMLEARSPWPAMTAGQVEPRFDGPTPEAGEDPLAVIDALVAAAEPGLSGPAGSRFFGWVIGASHPVGVAADMLTSAWGQNAGNHVASPSAAVAEAVAGRWLLDILGLPAGCSVGFVTGATMANFTCLAAARNAVLARVGWDVEADGLTGAPAVRIFLGEDAHATVWCALRYLGFGTRATRIPTDGQGRMDAGALAAALAAGDGPAIVVAQAGQINTGAFDPFGPIARTARAHGAWLHVDGAFGLWARAVPELGPLTEGVEQADSWATDGHKWLQLPYDSGFAIVRDAEAHRRAMSITASYLPPDRDAVPDPGQLVPELSRRARGFAAWAVIRALGRQGIEAMVRRHCALARRLAARLAAQPGVTVLNAVVLNQVVVAFGDGPLADAATEAVIARIRRDGVCLAGGADWHGRRVLRLSIISAPLAEADIDRLAEAVLSAWRAVRPEFALPSPVGAPVMKYASILETVGRTPVVELSRLAPAGVRLYAKVEAFNPMGSVKDRLALAAIERAERDGSLKPGQTVVEATSGNTGIGLAMVCAAKGYPLVVVMAESFSVERRRLMRFLGAKVVLTPASLKGTGMYLKAVELAEANGWFLVRQFENEANAEVHTRTTAEEILEDFEGERLDYWVTSFGTGGTLTGVARALRAARPETKIVVVEPDNARLLGGGVAQPAQTGPAPTSHPLFQPHPIQGTSPDFVSKLTADALAEGLIDQVLPVNGGDAMTMSQRLAQTEGVFAGISSGAALVGGLKLAAEAPAGSTILCMLPDTGERYLSTPLFAEVPVDMTAEELAISRSSPSARFELPSPAPAPQPAAAAPAPAVDAEAQQRLAQLVGVDPVVVFALEWCEFCWSLRRFLQALEIPHRVVALDAMALQEKDMGLRLRRALTARTGVATIPQVFVGGAFVGGCTDVFDSYAEGRLQPQLAAAGVSFRREAALSPYDLLPKWLHPRVAMPA